MIRGGIAFPANTGPQGPAGNDGVAGTVGATGATGPQGPTGPAHVTTVESFTQPSLGASASTVAYSGPQPAAPQYVILTDGANVAGKYKITASVADDATSGHVDLLFVESYSVAEGDPTPAGATVEPSAAPTDHGIDDVARVYLPTDQGPGVPDDGLFTVTEFTITVNDALRSLEVHAWIRATIAVGAQVSLLLDGGNYSVETIASSEYPAVLSGIPICLQGTRPLDMAGDYNILLCALAVGDGSSITPLANTNVLVHIMKP